MKTVLKMRLLVAGLALLSFAALPVRAQAPAASKPVMLKPNKPLEKCLQLDAGQKIEYRFEAAKKINFNLNYRRGSDEIYYPVKLDRTLSESGIYEAKTRNRYCLVWENRTDADVELTYSTKVGK
jgi:hypothetical protein